MHNENHPVEQTAPQKLLSEKESTLSVLMRGMVGENAFVPTERQVDEMLAQRREVHNFIHEDKKMESKDNRFYFGWTILVCLLIVMFVLFFAKEFLTQVLSLIVGAFGGYGFGRTHKS